MKDMTPEQRYQQQRQDRINSLEAQVNDLIARGFKRRAATLCLELIDAADTAAQRKQFAELRGMLIRSSAVGPGNQQTWYLAGNYMGGQ
ncbi:hypothetical protein [Scandinavium goeteborgense]|uniref:hypothetical protein n=1 Tax=Scandinavium goeteborgense TaxID=1851514 RepID=UPI0021658EFB|nr:hypothetical protein [Scandinavium goeteborgense]